MVDPCFMSYDKMEFSSPRLNVLAAGCSIMEIGPKLPATNDNES